MLTIYGSDLSAPAIKVRLTASYLGLDYKWHLVNLREGEHKQEWFLKINPVGKVPAIDDNGFYLFESNTICKYLADKHESALYPKEIHQRAVVDQWIDYISFHVSANLMPVVYNRVFAPRMGRMVNERAITEGLEFLKQYLPLLEDRLARQAQVVGSTITLADIVLLSVLEPAEVALFDLGAYPKLSAWRVALKQQKFYSNCYKEYGEMLKAPSGR